MEMIYISCCRCSLMVVLRFFKLFVRLAKSMKLVKYIILAPKTQFTYLNDFHCHFQTGEMCQQGKTCLQPTTTPPPPPIH